MISVHCREKVEQMGISFLENATSFSTKLLNIRTLRHFNQS